jgi:hypothetical protein
MKRVLFLTALLLTAVFSFAQDETGNRYIFIEGTADSKEHLEFFMDNFVIEAEGAGYTVMESKDEAFHTMIFNVIPNTGNIGGEEGQFPPDLYKYVIRISLVRNADEFEILAFDFFFTDLEEMNEHNRELFQTATLYIPPLTEEDLRLARIQRNRWKNKWIYFRGSFDYPITFYVLQPEGLVGGIGLYRGDFLSPDRVSAISHEVIAMPGGTFGVEVQFLNFMSLEANFQFSWGDTRSNYFINMAAGAELRFPIKFENIVLAPYGTFVYHLNVSEKTFSNFPPFAVGPGIQLYAKGGSRGAFFVDIKYIFSFGDAVMYNPYLDPDLQGEEPLFPNPALIHYRRSVIGVGIGYKIGFFDRARRERPAD